MNAKQCINAEYMGAFIPRISISHLSKKIMSSDSPQSSMASFAAGWITPTPLFLLLNLVIGTIFLSSRFHSKKTPILAGVPSSLIHRVKSIDFSLYKFHQHNSETESDYRVDSHQLDRAPSLLERVKSIDFSYNKFHQPTESDHRDDLPELVRAPSLLERVKSIGFSYNKVHQPTESDHRVDSPELVRAPSLLERVKSIDLSYTIFHQPPESDHRVESPGLVRVPSLLNLVKSINFGLHKSKQSDQSDPVDQDHHIKRYKSDLKPFGGELPAKLPKKLKKSASEKSPFRHFEEEEVEKLETQRPATARVEKPVPYGGDDAVDKKADDFINRFKQQLKLQRLDSILRYKDMIGRGAAGK